MGKGGWQGKLYWFAEFVTMLAVLQLMWIGLTLLGLVVFGITPATVGLFSVMRKRIQGKDSLRGLTIEYWQVYKREWLNANKIGIVLMVIGYFVILNLRIVLPMGGFSGLVMLCIMVMVTILYIIMLINIFQVFVHYELPFTRYFSTALLLSISFPIQAIGSFIGVFVLYKLFAFLPGLLPFFGISLTVIYLTWMSSQIFKIKDEQEGIMTYMKLGDEQECHT